MNWSLIKKRTRREIKPFWRAWFAVFFCYELFKEIKESAGYNNIKANYSPGWLVVAYIALLIFYKVPGPLYLICFLTFLPLFVVQDVVNRINSELAPEATPNNKFSGKNIIAIVIGGIFFILSVISEFIPEEYMAIDSNSNNYPQENIY
jgi:hypothetical protein